MKKLLFLTFFVACTHLVSAQNTPPAPTNEDKYYKMVTLPVPEGVLLEVGGMTTLPDGRLALATRRGEVWLVSNAAQQNNTAPYFKKFASGLHEILGLVYKDGSLIMAQRGELTKLTDRDGDGRADRYETIAAWPISSHYHEYSFGPKVAPDGSFFVSGNVAFGEQEWWRGESRVPYRGWVMKIDPTGKIEPWATGMRSPCGLGMVDGDLFYTDNQGDWMGSGGVWHVPKGAFTGHPAGLRWASTLPNSPIKLTTEQLYAAADPRMSKPGGPYIKPENVEKDPGMPLFKLKERFPEIKTPAVWLPHGILGISNAEIIRDETKGAFGPFAGQLFVGDQGQSKIMRVCMEKVKGEFQGAAFDFRGGFQSGVLRMAFGNDGSLFAGETNRGWGSAGTKGEGLERIFWTGKMPFEMKTVKAMPDGFEIEFTMPVARKNAEDLASYSTKSFIYKYHPVYGSPTINSQEVPIKGVLVSEDGLRVRVVLDNLRQYYIHELKLDGIRSQDDPQLGLLHSTAYYTLNNIPDGDALAMNELSTKNTAVAKEKAAAAKPALKPKSTKTAPTFAEVQPLLAKHTCLACHQTNKRQVGPAYAEVAKRKYSNEKIVELIYKPQPQNWPEYATEMAPMPQVPRADALKIAAWINSLANLSDQGDKQQK